MEHNEMDQFKKIYFIECFELLSNMEQLLMELDEAAIDLETVNAIFRCAHSIKGGAGGFGFKRLSQVTHVLETLLDILREGKAKLNQSMIDCLLSSVDILNKLVVAAQNAHELEDDFGHEVVTQLEELVLSQIDIKEVAKPSQKIEIQNDNVSHDSSDEIGIYDIQFKPHLNLFRSGNEPLLILQELNSLGELEVELQTDNLPSVEQLEVYDCYLSWHISLETECNESQIAEVFEFVEDDCEFTIEKIGAIVKDAPSEPLAIQSQINNLSSNEKSAESNNIAPAISTIRVDIDKVDRLVNLVGELVITQSMLLLQTEDMPIETFPKLIAGVEQLSQHTRELQEGVMAVRMQAVKSVFARMPRVVRDLSRQLGKQVKLSMIGENTEVDKTVIEQLSDPLVHMIRNSVDHGIGMPEDRKKKGKNECGEIKLSAEHRGGRIIIKISDDGEGLNRERIKLIAQEKELISENDTLTDSEIDNLIFAAGFSTAETVSDVSGRGVGMDVVRKNIESLGGIISLENKLEQGTVFTISIPLTLAILDGMIVRIGEEHYVLPINNMVETLRPSAKHIRKVADENDMINVRGEYLSLHYLYELFDIQHAETDPTKALIVIVETGIERYGLMVDELIGQQQVVIKSLEENTDPTSGVSGATILGDGKVSLIIDVTKVHHIHQKQKNEINEPTPLLEEGA